MGIAPRTAYILQIHKNPDQVNKFIQQLIADDQADVFVHIDRKNYENMNRKILKNPHVKVLRQSVNCEWGDIGQVDATLLLLKEVITSQNDYDFVCLRSGQDLLVKDGFKSLLTENRGKIFMNYRKMEDQHLGFMRMKWPKTARRRYTAAHPIRLYRRLLLTFYSKGLNLTPNTNNWPKEYSFYKGSQWFSVSFEAAKYMMNFLEDNPWYYTFFEHTLVPDESFFHTLIMNSPYKHAVINNNHMFLKWGETLGERNSPQNLSVADIQAIEESNDYFARKFDENIDSRVIEYFTERVAFSNDQKKELVY
ncbi:beta-1,6-N-acetylglucosaminyltransferase [Bacillus sp. B-jedd]|uniref:beta-1,6-N-acetylglucosaminyltransferase n=1 Tax=Bacillus sp. B-jedd TaxID=1476857 RepID=UPI0005155AD2|nr:beta-1,6-N-acetylglucosaminyltransferase [Bacillus sp. B-jedd]CEG28636.1 Core-2/I-Branching enzyme [Bacillus sp. B-jedd]